MKSLKKLFHLGKLKLYHWRATPQPPLPPSLRCLWSNQLPCCERSLRRSPDNELQVASRGTWPSCHLDRSLVRLYVAYCVSPRTTKFVLIWCVATEVKDISGVILRNCTNVLFRINFSSNNFIIILFPLYGCWKTYSTFLIANFQSMKLV